MHIAFLKPVDLLPVVTFFGDVLSWMKNTDLSGSVKSEALANWPINVAN